MTDEFSGSLRAALTTLRRTLNEATRLHLEAERYQGDFDVDASVAQAWASLALDRFERHHEAETLVALHTLKDTLYVQGLITDATLVAAVVWYEARYGVNLIYALWTPVAA